MEQMLLMEIEKAVHTEDTEKLNKLYELRRCYILILLSKQRKLCRRKFQRLPSIKYIKLLRRMYKSDAVKHHTRIHYEENL